MFLLPSPIEEISHSILEKHGVKLWIKRDDLIHPEVSGNKWRKLKYNIEEARTKGCAEILTFGGAFSNHIAATASATQHFGLRSRGIIRGEELNSESNQTLKTAALNGMELEFVSRDAYSILKFGHCYQNPKIHVIPEGGANALGVMGAGEIIDEIDQHFDLIITSIGTGTTMAGLIARLAGRKHVLGMSSLKGTFVHGAFDDLLLTMNISYSNYTMNTDYHFGGYGKTSPELIHFINEMREEIGVLFDPIYTGKALFGVWNMITNGKFDGQTLIFLHTGGLQGIAGHNQKSPQKIHI